MDDSLLRAAPSFDAWNELCAALDALEGAELEAALDRAETALASWPPRERSNGAWLEDDPRARIVRHHYAGGRRKSLADTEADLVAIAPHCISLSVRGQVGPELAALLTKHAAKLGHVTHLDLEGCKLGSEGAKHLAASGAFERVTHLDLRGCMIDGEGMEALASAPLMAGLVELSLGSNALGPRGGEALAKAPLEGVRRLDLDRAELEDEGVAAVAKASMPALEEVVLQSTGAGPLGAAGWGGAELPTLRSLDLSRNRNLGEAGAKALAETFSLPAVEALNVSVCSLGSAGIAALARCEAMASVRALDLRGNEAGWKGAKALANGVLRPKELAFGHNELKPKGAALLAGAPWFAELEALDVRFDGLKLEGARTLLDAGEGLREIVLADNGLGKSMKELAALPSLARLEKLDLDRNGIDGEGANALFASPHLKVKTLVLSGNDMRGAVLQGPVFESVEELEVERTKLGDEGIVTLVQGAPSPALRIVKVRASKATAASVDAIIAGERTLPAIESIVLAGLTKPLLKVEEWKARHAESPRIVRALVPSLMRKRVLGVAKNPPTASEKADAAPKERAPEAEASAPAWTPPPARPANAANAKAAACLEAFGIGHIEAAAWNDTGIVLATRGGVWRWDRRTFERIGGKGSHLMALSGDGRVVAVPERDGIVVSFLDQTRDPLRITYPETDKPWPIATTLSPGGDLLAFAHATGELSVVALPSGELLSRQKLDFFGFQLRVEQMAISDVGILAVADDHQTKRFARDGSAIGEPLPTFRPTRIRFHGERVYVTCQPSATSKPGDCFLRVFEGDTLVREVQTPSKAMYGQLADVALTRDGSRLFTGGRDQHLHGIDAASFTRFWLVEPRELDPVRRERVSWGKIEVRHLALSPDETELLVVSADEPLTLQVWQVGGARVASQVLPAGDSTATVSVARETGDVAYASTKGPPLLWRRGEPSPRFALELGRSEGVRVLALDPSGDEAVRCVGLSTQARCERVSRTGEVLREYPGHRDAVSCVGFDGDVTMTASYDGTIRLWRDGKEKCAKVLKVGARIRSAACAGGTVACAGDGVFHAWHGAGWKSAESFPSLGEKKRANHVAVHPSGELVAGRGWERVVWVWSLDGKRRDFEAPTDGAGPVAFSEDGALLFGGSKAGIEVWEVESGRHLATWALGESASALEVAGGRVHALTRSGRVEIWGVATLEDADATSDDLASTSVPEKSSAATVRLERDDRFYEVTLDGTKMTTRYGKKGGKGRSRAKSFATAAEASAASDEKIAEQEKKGYARR